MNRNKESKSNVIALLYYRLKVIDQKGVVAPMVAVLLTLLIGFTALAVDIGYYMVTRNELQNIADAAALAGCGKLGEIYQNLSPAEQKAYVCENPNIIINEAIDVANENKAGGVKGISILPEDVIIGTWDEKTNILTQTLTTPDAVRVIARRDDNANSPLTTFFARVLSINTIEVRMDATAALTGQSTTEPGELELPIGISSYFFQGGNFCNDFIVFNPTNDPDSCAGWHSYDISPPNDNLLRDILDGKVTSPGTTAGDTEFNFIGGNLSNPTFDALLLLFMRKGYDTQVDGITPSQTYTDEDGNTFPVTGPLADGAEGTDPLYEDGERAYYPDDKQNPTPRNRHRWETTVPVYAWETCANPNTTILIVGYAKIAMTNVQNAPEKRIEGEIMCDLFSNFSTRGGGGQFGVKGTIPGLVE